jgi:hypothetical protein
VRLAGRTCQACGPKRQTPVIVHGKTKTDSWSEEERLVVLIARERKTVVDPARQRHHYLERQAVTGPSVILVP